MADLITSIRIQILDAFSAPLKRFEEALGGVKKSMEGVRSSFRVAADLNQAAEAMGRVSGAFANAMRQPIERFADFEQSMAKVAAMTGEDGTEAFRKMEAAAKDLGATTSYSASQAAEAMAAFGQQGRTANEILEVTPAALSLARAGMIDLGEAARILGTAMSGMQLGADQTGRIADVLALAANAANTDVRGLGDAFSYVGPVAKDAGLSFEQTAAMLGKLADAGMDSNRAGTGLRGVMSRLLSPSKEATKALHAFGLSHRQINELQKNAATGNLGESLRVLGEMGAKLPDEKRLKLLSDIFGQETQSAASALISAKLDVTSGRGLDDLIEKLVKASGAAKATANIMDRTLSGELERTGGAIEDLSIKLGQLLRPSVMRAAQAVQDLVAGIVGWVEKNPELANTLLRLAVAITGATLALKGMLLVASAIVSTTAALKAAHAAYVALRAVIVATPAVLAAARMAFIAFDASLTGASALWLLKTGGLVVAAAALGYAVGTLINDWTGASEKLQSAFEWLMGDDYSDRKQNKDEQVYADGSVVNTKTGQVVKIGTGNEGAPLVVRQARAAGKAGSVDEVNAFASTAGAGSAAPFTPARTTTAGAPLTSLAPEPSTVDDGINALVRSNERGEKTMRDLLDEVRRSNRRAPGSGGTTPLGAL